MKSKNRKHIVYTVIACACISLLTFPGLVRAETVTSFDVDMEVQEDTSLNVEERITYDFEESSRHGIYRDIPYRYETPYGTRSIHIDVVSVTKDDVSEPFETSRSGGDLRIRIGDPDVFVDGSHIYQIDYRVRGTLNYFENHDEIYWNVTGHEWSVPIDEVYTEIHLPQAVDLSLLSSVCYKGIVGSTEKCVTTPSAEGMIAVSENLSVGEGVTVVLGFPKGLVTPPSFLDRVLWWISDNWILFVPIILFFSLLVLWYKRGKDPKKRSVIAQYEPPKGFNPTFVGIIMDEHVHSQDIAAGIIYLAQTGFIKIRHIREGKVFKSDEYEFTLQRETHEQSDMLLRSILKLMFNESTAVGTVQKMSDIKKDTKNIAASIKELREDAKSELIEKGVFEHGSLSLKVSLMVAAGVMFALAFIFAGVFGLVGLLSGIISAALLLIFGYLMSRRTEEGMRMYEHLLGFKDFLSVTDRERFDFHNAPEKKPETFMEYLSYAVAFGVEKKWSKQFEGMTIPAPDWYSSNMGGSFTPIVFAGSMSSFSNSIGSSMSSSAGGGSGISGGGAGGGFGGGGGGSW